MTLDTLLIDAQRASQLTSGELFQEAYEAIDALGYEPGALAGNPFAIWDKFFRETLGPFLDRNRAQLNEAIVVTLASFRSEEFNGPLTAKLLIVAGLADALRKMLPVEFGGQFDFNALSSTDWAVLALATMTAWSVFARTGDGK